MTPRASGSRDGLLIAKMHVDEVEIDETLVRLLLAHQFPDWVDRPLSAISAAVIRSCRSATTITTRSAGVRFATRFGADERSRNPARPQADTASPTCLHNAG